MSHGPLLEQDAESRLGHSGPFYGSLGLSSALHAVEGSRRLSDTGGGGGGTLAQRADMARSKHQSVSPEKCVRARLDDGYKSDEGTRSSVRDRVGQSPRPSSVRDRIGAREVNNGSSDKNIFSRLGSRL